MIISTYAIPGLKFRRQLTYMDATPDKILTLVSNIMQVDIAEFKTKSRKRELVVCRQICMYLLKMNSRITLRKIGSIFNTDHKTVIYSCDTLKV